MNRTLDLIMFSMVLLTLLATGSVWWLLIGLICAVCVWVNRKFES